MADPSSDDKILATVKQLVDLPVSYDVFDPKLLLMINSVTMTLDDLGIGPSGGFYVDSNSTWSELVGSPDWIEDDEFEEWRVYFSGVMSYVGLKVRLQFDPPQLQFLLASLEKMIEQAEWRLNVRREFAKSMSARVAESLVPIEP